MSSHLRRACCAVAVLLAATATPVFAAHSATLARVRARGSVQCAGVVRPGVAVPTVDGKRWYGISVDVCRAVAAAVLGDPERMTFRPYFGDDEALHPLAPPGDDIIFLSGAELVGALGAEAAPLFLGPAIVHDAIGLLVPAGGAARARDLAGKSICVEPGTVSDRALGAYFARHAIALQEHPFQETDEMRQAYGDGECDGLAGPLTTLANLRADPREGHPADRILPERLVDDPIYAATGNDPEWARIVAWTFGALVAADAATPPFGVPPAVGRELGLSDHWSRDALAAGGTYDALFERNLGAHSRLRLERAANASIGDGGSIYGLFAE